MLDNALLRANQRFIASRDSHMLGVVSMALGAGLIGFGVLRGPA